MQQSFLNNLQTTAAGRYPPYAQTLCTDIRNRAAIFTKVMMKNLLASFPDIVYTGTYHTCIVQCRQVKLNVCLKGRKYFKPSELLDTLSSSATFPSTSRWSLSLQATVSTRTSVTHCWCLVPAYTQNNQIMQFIKIKIKIKKITNRWHICYILHAYCYAIL